jgi:hypothetical protein
MQTLGVMSFLMCICCMFLIYLNFDVLAQIVFGISLLLFAGSLLLSLLEIRLSTRAIELELSDMEGMEDPSVLEYLKNKLEGKE